MQYDNARPVYYLKKWQYYEAARHELSEVELEDAKIFFNALKQLNEQDRKILSDVYYYSKKLSLFKENDGYYHSLVPVRDETIAKKYGVPTKQFSNMRRRAQTNLKKEMQNILKKIPTSSFLFRINTRLYLVDVIKNSMNERQYVTGTEQRAKIFSQVENVQGLFVDLMILGFEKIPVKEGEKE